MNVHALPIELLNERQIEARYESIDTVAKELRRKLEERLANMSAERAEVTIISKKIERPESNKS